MGLLPSQVVAPFLQEAPTGGARTGDGRSRSRAGGCALQPRQGAVPGHRLHQRPGHRLLRPDRAGDAPPPRGPARRRWCGCPTASTASGSSRSAARGHQPEWVDTVPLDADSEHHGLLVDERARARVDGQPRRARAAHPPGPRRRSVAADRDRARPRPRTEPEHARLRRVALELRDLARPARAARRS